MVTAHLTSIGQKVWSLQPREQTFSWETERSHRESNLAAKTFDGMKYKTENWCKIGPMELIPVQRGVNARRSSSG